VKDRAHTGALADLGGLREQAPGLAGVLGFAAIASLGLPGLAGFWGEAFAVVASLRHSGPLWNTLGAIAAVGGALTAAYFLRVLRRVTHGPASPVVAAMPATSGSAPQVPLGAGLARPELVSWGPLVVLALAIGLVPALVLGMAHDPVQALTEAVHR
jgi:NADH-quinone oxidoreductase subunit M